MTHSFLTKETKPLQFCNSARFRWFPIKAFTLAEVLITLAIIGIIAALTIPTLMKNYEKHVVLNQLKTNYALLEQANRMAIQDGASTNFYDYINSNNYDSSCINWTNTFLKPYLKISKTCINQKGCWNPGRQTTYLNNDIPPYSRAGYGIGGSGVVLLVMENGAQLSTDWYNRGNMSGGFGTSLSDSDPSEPNYWGHGIGFYLDVNGNKGPNVVGKDIFVLAFSEKGIVPAGTNKTPKQVKQDCSKGNQGKYCLLYIIQSGWQMPKDYPW